MLLTIAILMYVSRLGILLFCVDFVSIAIGMHHALIDFHLQDMRSHFIFLQIAKNRYVFVEYDMHCGG